MAIEFKRKEDVKEALKGIYVQEINKRLEEFEEYIEKRDPVQASEKIYKAAEEFVKLLAESYDLLEAREAKLKGKWTRRLLDKASYELGLTDIFDIADKLHVWGFHERSMDIDDVANRGKIVAKKIQSRLEKEGFI
ncbi:MAG: PaREP1 family protein [Caldisphaera sp.]